MLLLKSLACCFVSLFLLQSSEALECYVCNNCVKFELSQSRTCPIGSTHCMKLDMRTGLAQRRCATFEICQNPEKFLKTKNKRTSCCEENNCNSGPRQEPWARHLFAVHLLLYPMLRIFF